MGKYIEMARQVPVRNKTHKPYAVKIRSKILGEDVWVATSPEAITFIPEIYFLPGEIRNLKGATAEEIQAVHQIKKTFPVTTLIEVKERKKGVK